MGLYKKKNVACLCIVLDYVSMNNIYRLPRDLDRERDLVRRSFERDRLFDSERERDRERLYERPRSFDD